MSASGTARLLKESYTMCRVRGMSGLDIKITHLDLTLTAALCSKIAGISMTFRGARSSPRLNYVIESAACCAAAYTRHGFEL